MRTTILWIRIWIWICIVVVITITITITVNKVIVIARRPILLFLYSVELFIVYWKGFYFILFYFVFFNYKLFFCNFYLFNFLIFVYLYLILSRIAFTSAVILRHGADETNRLAKKIMKLLSNVLIKLIKCYSQSILHLDLNFKDQNMLSLKSICAELLRVQNFNGPPTEKENKNFTNDSTFLFDVLDKLNQMEWVKSSLAYTNN